MECLRAEGGRDGVDEGGEFAGSFAEPEALFHGAFAVEAEVGGGPGGFLGGGLGVEGQDAELVGVEACAQELSADIGSFEGVAEGAQAFGDPVDTEDEGFAAGFLVEEEEERFEEVAVGVEAVHHLVVVACGEEVAMGGEGEVELVREGVVKAFDFAPGEGGFQVIATRGTRPLRLVTEGFLGGQGEDRVVACGRGKVASHGLGNVERCGVEARVSGDALESQQGAGDDAAIEEVSESPSAGERFEGHVAERGVPLREQVFAGAARLFEDVAVAGDVEQVEHRGDGVSGDFVGNGSVAAFLGEVVAGDAGVGFDDAGAQEPARGSIGDRGIGERGSEEGGRTFQGSSL